MAIKWNAITGNLDLVGAKQTNVEFAEKISAIFDCLAAASVGDLVAASRTTAGTVEHLAGNVYNDLVFGVIIDKPTTTTCEVLVSGKLSGASYNLAGLEFGKPIFVGTSGELTTAVPTTGHLQKMGVAIEADTIFLLPAMEKVVRA